MEGHKKGLSYRIKWLSNIIKHGMFWHGVRNNFAKIGLDFMPYYWETGSINIEPPKIRGDATGYKLSEFGKEELKYIKKTIIGIEHKDLLSDVENGDICLGIKYKGEIAVYTLIKLKPFDFRGRRFDLKPNESYLHSMYTFEDYRGKNLAPYLRYQSYKYLKDNNVDKYYSISEYFNKATLRFKRKLKVNPVMLCLSIIAFKKWTFNFKLKTFV